MKHAFRHAFLCAAVVSVVASGCDEQKAPASSSPASSAKTASQPSGQTQAAPPPPAAPELEEVKNEKMGYTIKLPKGANTAMSDANGGSYGHDTMVILVGPTGVALASPDDLLRGVNTDGGKIEKKTEGDVLVAIVEKPNSPVNIYAGPKGAKMASTCMTEPAQKALAIQICSSLKATKK